MHVSGTPLNLSTFCFSFFLLLCIHTLVMSVDRSPLLSCRSFSIYAVTVLGLFLLWMLVMPQDDFVHTVTPPTTANVIINNSNNQKALKKPFVTPPHSLERLCTPTTYNKGEWKRQSMHIKNNSTRSFAANVKYTCPSHFAHKCFARNENELLRNKQIAEWQWQPDDCDLLPMDTHRLAKHLSDHPLLLVGDSITQLQYESMGCLLGESMSTLKTPTNMTGGDKAIKVSELHYADAVKPKATIRTPAMAYLRSDFGVRVDDLRLIQPFEEEGDLLGLGHNFPWVHALPRFDYIVFNTGAHWHTNLRWGSNTNEDELLKGFRNAMAIIFDHLKRTIKPHQRVWIRSTPFGHKDCSRHTRPATLTHPIDPPSGQPGEYEWHLFPVFDAVWKDWIEEWQKLHPLDKRFAYLDISDMTNLRGDAHSKPDRDCLHTCLPGPVDDWNRLLYHEIGRSALEQYQDEASKHQLNQV